MIFSPKQAAGLAGAVLVLLGLSAGPITAADEGKASGLDTKAVEKIIRDYLMKNPKIVNDALEAHQRNLERQEQLEISRAIKSRRNEIRHDPGSVVGGNPEGDVTVVEFFDYRCGVCKRVHPIVEEVIKRDGKIRRVYKEWPILGPQSVYASRAAIAARKQGDDKYLKFHHRMMTARQSLNPGTVMKIAARAGLDTAQLRRDLKDPEIDDILRRNHELAQALKLTGTPSFLIGDILIRGGRDADTMLKIVRDAREKS